MINIALKDIEHRRLKNVICLTREDFFPISSGMFIEAFDNIFTSDEFEIRKMNVKDWMSRIFKDPKHDDCIICVDLYNQIVAGILSGMTGNENLFPTVYRGDQYSLYEPNFYPDVPGFNSANPNPTSAIIATSAIMSYLGMDREADEIIDALCDCYANMQRTPDVGGSLTTEEFTDKIISHL